MEQKLSDYLRARRATRQCTFRPGAHYSPDGDHVWYRSRPGRCVARHVDDLLVVYETMDTRELAGCSIHGIRRQRIADEAVKLGVLVEGQPVKVRLLLLYGAWRAQTPDQRGQYRAVAALVGDAALAWEELTRRAPWPGQDGNQSAEAAEEAGLGHADR